jgi:hypothetical protein
MADPASTACRSQRCAPRHPGQPTFLPAGLAVPPSGCSNPRVTRARWLRSRAPREPSGFGPRRPSRVGEPESPATRRPSVPPTAFRSRRRTGLGRRSRLWRTAPPPATGRVAPPAAGSLRGSGRVRTRGPRARVQPGARPHATPRRLGGADLLRLTLPHRPSSAATPGDLQRRSPSPIGWRRPQLGASEDPARFGPGPQPTAQGVAQPRPHPRRLGAADLPSCSGPGAATDLHEVSVRPAHATAARHRHQAAAGGEQGTRAPAVRRCRSTRAGVPRSSCREPFRHPLHPAVPLRTRAACVPIAASGWSRRGLWWLPPPRLRPTACPLQASGDLGRPGSAHAPTGFADGSLCTAGPETGTLDGGCPTK